MSSVQQRHVRRLRSSFVTFFAILALCAGFALPSAAQPAAEWALFELPEGADLILGAVPGSEEAVSMLPAEGVAGILFEDTPFEQVTAAAIDPTTWQSAPNFELWPGETLVLRAADGRLWKIGLLPPRQDWLTIISFLSSTQP